MLKRSIITALFVTCGVSHAGDMSHSAVYGLSSGIRHRERRKLRSGQRDNPFSGNAARCAGDEISGKR